MLLNYLQVAFRNLLKYKFYSLINIVGLSLGLASVFLILQYLKQELSYDRFHLEAENIYRITWEDENPQTRTPYPMTQALVQDFPQVEQAVSLTPLWGTGLTKRTFSFRNLEKDIRFDEINVLAVDTTFFKVFNFPLVKGDPKNVLKDPGGILMSESMAKKYFGDEDAVGKHLAVNDEEDLIEVVGIFQDVPQTSHFHFDFLVSYVREKGPDDEESQFYSWQDFGHYNYIRLRPGTDAKQLEAKLVDWVRKYIDISDELYRSIKDKNFGFRLQPITDIHLHSHLRWELEANGYIAYIYMMTAAAILILIIASVNFINLTTAQSAGRAKEIGIRKSLGAFRNQLAIQFTGESLVVSFMAMLLAIVFIELAASFFTRATGTALQIDYLFFTLSLLGLTLITGILAGLFPSLYLASAKPSQTLRGRLLQTPKSVGFRQGFIILQFSASMILITSSLIIYSQLEFMQNKELGFRQEEVIVLPIKNRDAINPRFDELRRELLQIPGVKFASAASNVPGRPFNQNPVFATNDPQQRIASSEALVDYDFFDVLNVEFLDGRPFSRENPADKDAFILNETAAKNLYNGQAVGKEFSWDYDAGIIKGSVIGVVKDFHFQSLHEPVRPLLFRLSPHYNYVLIKLNTDNFSNTINEIENKWATFDPQFAFEFSFLSDYLNQQYRLEQNMATVVGTFSVVAIAVACFGLLAIAALSFRQKVKEVSIRKVLGATMQQIMMLLVKDFTRVVLIAIVLSVPLVWWMMNDWLQNFTFRTTISPVIFVISGMTLLILAWLTLSYLLWKISNINPVETLKNE